MGSSQEKPEAQEQKVSKVVLKNISSIVLLLAIVILIRGSVIEAYRIPSESMVPTLMIEDYILVSKLSYGFRLPFVKKSLFRWSEPKRGDVVVFTREDYIGTPKIDEGEHNIIKRVIGLPGDTVSVRKTTVKINGKAIKEPYAIWQENGSPAGEFGPVTVPEGSVFVMGDNRDHSKDSRLWEGTHFLPFENIKGRALVVYISTNNFSRIGTIIR